MATKRITPNRYKPGAASEKKPKTPPREKMSGRLILGFFFMTLMSLWAIYLHDMVVQSPFFTIKTIDISGITRVSETEILTQAGLDRETNLFALCPHLLEKKISAHPWVARAKVKRRLFSTLAIEVEEHQPLAIVNIENLTDIIINRQGVPFKEYEPARDRLHALPVISGMDLTLSNQTYMFEGELFNAVMDLLQIRGLSQIKTIHGDAHTGLLIQAPDIYNQQAEGKEGPKPLIPIKLGFSRFKEKMTRAGEISRYMAAHYPLKTITAMDLYNMEKIFIKTEDTLHNTLEKGV